VAGSLCSGMVGSCWETERPVVDGTWFTAENNLAEYCDDEVERLVNTKRSIASSPSSSLCASWSKCDQFPNNRVT